MINLLKGAPGGGKSYEAVVFHILAALAVGRKVITNLALNLAAFGNIEPGYLALIELRTATKGMRPRSDTGKPKAWNGAAFAQLEDYGDPWRHPVTGAGPLYVIDEAHIPLPKVGTPVAVEEWFAIHRHEFADVLLISQSYGKLNAAVRDLLQIVYSVRKNIALGSSKSYTRKVQDGVRGSVVNTAVRRYESKYFFLYKSHTRSGIGMEMGASDVVPLWRHWTVYGIGVCAIVFAGLWMKNGSPFAMFSPKVPVKAAGVVGRTIEARPGVQAAVVAAVAVGDKPVAQAAASWPYGALELHVGGFARSAKKTVMLITFSQNGQRVFEQNSSELEAAGYRVTALNDCLVHLEFGKLAQYISCDSPRVGVGVGSSVQRNQAAGPVESSPASRAVLPIGERS